MHDYRDGTIEMTKRSSKNLTQILGEKNTLLNLEKYFKEQKERPLTRYDPLVKYFSEKLQAIYDFSENRQKNIARNYAKINREKN